MSLLDLQDEDDTCLVFASERPVLCTYHYCVRLGRQTWVCLHGGGLGLRKGDGVRRQGHVSRKARVRIVGDAEPLFDVWIVVGRTIAGTTCASLGLWQMP